jgi:hypothetical protein
MSESEMSGVALLVGAGDAIGAAVARRFAAGGYRVCVARRDAEKSRSLVQEIVASGGVARAVGTDVRNEEAVQALFAQVEAELGPVEICLFNAGANVKTPLIETSSRLFFRAWELACYGGFLTGREAARYMVPRGRGTILFTGATASLRGGLRRLCGRQVRPARGRTVHGARAHAEEYPRRASDHRWRGRQRGDPQATERRHRDDARFAAGRLDPDQLRRRSLLGITQPVARRLDARARHPSL